MAQHNELGKKGEVLARQYIENKGFEILETNWHFEKAEVDIIARDKDDLVMIEVKTRSTDYFGNPEEAVTTAKEERLIMAAEAYLEINELSLDVRYDIISIVLSSKKKEIYHIEDAFYPQ